MNVYIKREKLKAEKRKYEQKITVKNIKRNKNRKNQEKNKKTTKI